jgi:peptidyl-tRNA hydrolase, PTH1 family
MIRLLVGLGNPGPEYVFTRHNVGWLYLDALTREEHPSWQEKFNGAFTRQVIAGESRYLLKPLTFMNRSGHSVSTMMQYFNIRADEILVIHDDLELPFGTIAYKYSGGLGGHNGLRSLTAQLGSPDFGRLRIGIGRPAHNNITAYVLGPFPKEEESQLDAIFDLATAHLDSALDSDFPQYEKLNLKIKLTEALP